MPFRYAVLQNPSTTLEREMEASFDFEDSEVEDDDIEASRLLNSERDAPLSPQQNSQSGQMPYDFENLDYDYPPPGSPPRPSASALPNNTIGNSNGQLPGSPQIPLRQRPGWIRRTAAAILPTQLFGGSTRSTRVVGGGIENDGVFANINAKPVPGRVVEDGENGIYVVPEEVQKDAPPSYALAQADAVPPYWETTILTPATLGSVGEMMVDGMPTGSFFSFLWNLLVSMSFQFVGFLLTFLLHSTHAAKLGSRAGLGITLIHYGFYLRTRTNYNSGNGFLSDSEDGSSWTLPTSTSPSLPKPTFGTAAEAEGFYGNEMASNKTTDPILSLPSMTFKPVLGEGTAEWLSFLLMTIGWFILLTSALSFWRVKRWERSIIASTPPELPADDATSRAHRPFFTLEQFGFPGAIFHSVHFGTSARADLEHDEEALLESEGEQHRMLSRQALEDVESAANFTRARSLDMQFERNLRAAGLL